MELWEAGICWFPIFQLVIWIATLFFLFTTTLMEPGIIPSQPPEVSVDVGREIESDKVMDVCYIKILIISSFIHSIITVSRIYPLTLLHNYPRRPVTLRLTHRMSRTPQIIPLILKQGE